MADSQRADLAWLGLTWDEEVAPQSERDYAPWLARLGDRTYRCTCTRKELKAVDGRCRCPDGDHTEGAVRFRLTPGMRTIQDRGLGIRRSDPADRFPDPVLRRRDGVFSYTLAVVADDLADGVTEVVRGGDLVDFSAVQEQVWEVLGATPPTWMHTPLVLGSDGRKLSKSHGSTEIRALRAGGATPDDIWQRVLPWLGLSGSLPRALELWETRSWTGEPVTVSDTGT